MSAVSSCNAPVRDGIFISTNQDCSGMKISGKNSELGIMPCSVRLSPLSDFTVGGKYTGATPVRIPVKLVMSGDQKTVYRERDNFMSGIGLLATKVSRKHSPSMRNKGNRGQVKSGGVNLNKPSTISANRGGRGIAGKAMKSTFRRLKKPFKIRLTASHRKLSHPSIRNPGANKVRGRWNDTMGKVVATQEQLVQQSKPCYVRLTRINNLTTGQVFLAPKEDREPPCCEEGDGGNLGKQNTCQWKDKTQEEHDLYALIKPCFVKLWHKRPEVKLTKEVFKSGGSATAIGQKRKLPRSRSGYPRLKHLQTKMVNKKVKVNRLNYGKRFHLKPCAIHLFRSGSESSKVIPLDHMQTNLEDGSYASLDVKNSVRPCFVKIEKLALAHNICALVNKNRTRQGQGHNNVDGRAMVETAVKPCFVKLTNINVEM